MIFFKNNRTETSGLLTRKTVLALACSVFILPTAAHAGFEWTPPPVIKRDAGPAVSAVPVPEVSAVAVDGIAATAEDSAAPQDQGVNIDTDPFTTPVLEESTTLSTIPVPQTEDREYETVQGFGRDIPLALVMQQIIPPGYAYSFDTEVNPGLRVSWNGGKPWNVVLQDALTPFHIGVTVTDMTVWLRPAAEIPAPVATAAAAEEPADITAQEMDSKDYELHEMTAAATPLVADGGRELITDPSELAAIGKDDGGYNPSYPRRIPVPMAAPVNKPAAQADAAPTPINPPAGTVSAALDSNPPAETTSAEPASNPFAETGPTPAPFAEPVKIPQPQMLSLEHKDAPMEEVTAAATAEKTPPVLDLFEIRYWQAEKDESLKDTLAKWVATSGVKLYWGAGSDYKLPKAVHMHGTFSDAVTEILSAYGEASDRPLGRLHPNLPDGPSVLIIQSNGSTKAVN